jgi:hypothetical protein
MQYIQRCILLFPIMSAATSSSHLPHITYVPSNITRRDSTELVANTAMYCRFNACPSATFKGMITCMFHIYSRLEILYDDARVGAAMQSA